MSQVEVRTIVPNDKAAVLQLLNEVFSDVQRSSFTRGDAFWTWKYEANVFGTPILIVAVLDGKIVGFSNLWPWAFKYRGKIYKGLQPCDSVVHKDYQKYGIFLKMRMKGLQIASEQEYDVIFNFPNQNSLPSYLKMGWNFLGNPTWYIHVLSPVKILIARFVKSKSVPISLDSKYDLDCAALEKLSFNNADFSKYFATNYVPGYFKWRYTEHPSLKYGMVLYEKGHKSIAAIFTIKQNGGVREMIIVDVVGDYSSFDHLLRLIKQTAKDCNVDFFALFKSTRFGQFNPLRYGLLPMKNKNFAALPLNISLESHLSSINNWSLMASMHDSI